MGVISIASFRPRPGREADLLAVMHDRAVLMKKLGLVTDRPAIHARSREGMVLMISEWKSREAIETAHSTPAVQALWERFETCCEYVSLDALSEVREPFASFEAI